MNILSVAVCLIQRGLAQPNEPIFRLLLKIAVRYPHSQLPQLLEHSGVPPVMNNNQIYLLSHLQHGAALAWPLTRISEVCASSSYCPVGPTILVSVSVLLPYIIATAAAWLYLLGLLAKIKCSICSYQLNIWYGNTVPSILN